MNGRSLFQIIGIDVNTIALTMLALVAAYLVLTHTSGLNSLIKTSTGAFSDDLVILQGRNVKTAGR